MSKYTYNPLHDVKMQRALSDGSSSLNNLTLKGNWDADTNTPELLDVNGSIGDWYIVSVAGTTPLTTPQGV